MVCIARAGHRAAAGRQSSRRARYLWPECMSALACLVRGARDPLGCPGGASARQGANRALESALFASSVGRLSRLTKGGASKELTRRGELPCSNVSFRTAPQPPRHRPVAVHAGDQRRKGCVGLTAFIGPEEQPVFAKTALRIQCEVCRATSVSASTSWAQCALRRWTAVKSERGGGAARW